MSISFAILHNSLELISILKKAVTQHIETAPGGLMNMNDDDIVKTISFIEELADKNKKELSKYFDVDDLKQVYHDRLIKSFPVIHRIDPSNPNSNGTDSPKDWQPV